MAEKKKRGFAAMDPEKRKAIAAQGGRNSQRQGKGHRFTTSEAAEAGRLGGLEASRDRAFMADLGKKGGSKSGRKAVRSRGQGESQRDGSTE
jgi:uncharacterized protein